MGAQLLVRSGASTCSLQVFNCNLPRHEIADTFRHQHSPPGLSPRVYIFMGRGQNVSTVWEMSVSSPRFKAPVPVNDPVSILKSVGTTFWKA